MRLFESAGQAARSIRRSPAYASAAVVSVAVGLALATATFAFVDTVRFRRPPWPDLDRLYYERLRFGSQRNPPSVGERVRLLQGLAGVEAVVVSMPARLGEVATERMRNGYARVVSLDYWKVFGMRPRLGHFPTADEARAGRTVIIEDEFWQREFGNRPRIDGATVRIGDQYFDVAAVLPPEVKSFGTANVWIPFGGTAAIDTLRESAYRGSATITVKLRPGFTADRLTPDLDRIAANLTSQYVRGGEPPFVVQLRSLGPRARGFDSMTILLYLLGFGILAIGCANVAALTLARGLRRRRDYAVRLALGASRRAIAGDVLGEVSLLTAIGSALGVGLTYALLGLFRWATPVELTWRGLEVPELSTRTFVFCSVAMLVAVALGGAFPALRASRIAPSEPLKDGAGTTTGRSRSEFRLLLIAELAVAMVLLMMASLESVSLRNIMTYEFGFPTHAIVNGFVGAGTRTDRFTARDIVAMQAHTLDVVRSTPGVRAAALRVGAEVVPDRQVSSDRSASGEPVLLTRFVFTVGPRYFTALGVPIHAGRDFLEADLQDRGAAIVSAFAARQLFPRGDAIGRLIKIGGPDKPGAWVPVVGISEDFTERPMADPEDRDPPVYFVARDTVARQWTIVARADSAASSLVAPLQARLRDALPARSTIGISTFSENIDQGVQYMSYFVRVFGALGFAALLLSALGVFSVLSYVVGQRTREFAVRVSLGASPGNLIKVVMRSALEFALGGTAIGALLSFWASAGLSGLLFGVKNTDPMSLVIAETVLIGTCILAALVPALRASRADPLEILRAV